MELLKNRKSFHDYKFNESFNCGIVLTGNESKMIRNKRVIYVDTYCYLKDGEVWVKGIHIERHENGDNRQDPKRDKKLLLKRREIEKIQKELKNRSMVLIPTSIYINERNLIKVKISIGTGKKKYDKRNDLKIKEMKRDINKIKTV